MELVYHNECRENSKYMHGTLKVHYVERVMSDLKCKLNFYMTSISNETINEIEYDCKQGTPVVDNFYLVFYKGELWPGQVTAVKKTLFNR